MLSSSDRTGLFGWTQNPEELSSARVVFRCKVCAPVTEQAVIYNAAVPPKTRLWRLLSSVDEYAYTGGVCVC